MRDYGRRIVAAPQQILRVVEPRPNEPAGAWHAMAVGDDLGRAALCAHVAEIPDGAPELLRIFHRPAMQRQIVRDRGPMTLTHELHEARQLGALDTLGGRGPDRLHCRPGSAAQRAPAPSAFYHRLRPPIRR